jgi:phosphoribosylanthranilate isomerase
VKLKLSPINNLSDARFAAAAGFHYMGFCFDPSSEDFVLPIKAKEIIDWTTGSNTVGEFGNQSAEDIYEIADLLGVDVVLINNTILPDELPSIGKPIIKAIDLNVLGLEASARELEAYSPYCDAFQVNTSTLNDAEITWLNAFVKNFKIILNCGNASTTIHLAIQQCKPFAINLHAGKEDKAGMRDFSDLNELLEGLADI